MAQTVQNHFGPTNSNKSDFKLFTTHIVGPKNPGDSSSNAIVAGFTTNNAMKGIGLSNENNPGFFINVTK